MHAQRRDDSKRGTIRRTAPRRRAQSAQYVRHAAAQKYRSARSFECREHSCTKCNGALPVSPKGQNVQPVRRNWALSTKPTAPALPKLARRTYGARHRAFPHVAALLSPARSEPPLAFPGALRFCPPQPTSEPHYVVPSRSHPATPPWTLGPEGGSHPTPPPCTFAGNVV